MLLTMATLTSFENDCDAVSPRTTGVLLAAVGVKLSDLVKSNEIVANVCDVVTVAANVFVAV